MVPSVNVYVLSFFCSISLLSSTDPEEYLSRYGYLHTDPVALTSKDDLIQQGVLKFQDYMGLNQTGILDEATTQLMQTPRCGVKDINEEDDIRSGRLKRYAIASRWRKKQLNYMISQYSKSLPRDSINEVITSALDMWQNAADFSVNKVRKESNADILVSFLKGSHTTNRTVHTDKKLSFDGPGGVLAHASFPTLGEIHFDDTENWLIDTVKSEGSKMGYSLKWAAVHEMGHALGLKHTRVPNNVMNPVYKKYAPDKLGDDDMEGIVRLYGAPRKEVTKSSTIVPISTSTEYFISPTVDSCISSGKVDAVLTLGKTMFMFRDNDVWIFNGITGRFSVPQYPQKISTAFPGIKGPLTAVMAGINNKIYFFRRKYYWRWDLVNKSVDRGYPRTVAGFGNIHTEIIAAFRWEHNGKGYLFGGNSKYWRYDFWSKRIDAGYPRDIRKWRGIPNDLDEITSAPDGNTYVFKDDSFWVYSSKDYRILGHRYEIEEKWRSCAAEHAHSMLVDASSSANSTHQSASKMLHLTLSMIILILSVK